eukprot:COSAG03_NODE_561_length_6938_cov_4.845591_5_plen_355_part_00
MQQQAETAARAESALAAALEAKAAAELEATLARKAVDELKLELSVPRSVVGGGDSTFPLAESAVRPPQDGVPSEASYDTMASAVSSRAVPASSSLSATRQRSNQRTRRSRRGRPLLSASELLIDQTAEPTGHSRGSRRAKNDFAPKVSEAQTVYDVDATDEFSAEVTEPQLSPRSAATKSRLDQARNASATGVPGDLIDPPRVVVRRLQRPGSAPAFHHTPISAAAHEEAPHSKRARHRNGGLTYRRTKGRQAALQMPLHFPSPISGDESGAGSRQRDKRGSARRRQRLSSPRSAVPRAANGGKWRGRQRRTDSIESQQQLSAEAGQGMGISTRALHHLDVYTTAGRSRHTLEW